MLSKEKSLELKKHVGAIHSSNKLTLVQRKIANALLYNAYYELMDKDEHTIHIKDLCALIGYDSKDFKAIKKALVNLLSTVIEWNLVDKETNGEGIWNASSIIADASIDGPLCTYSYSNKMKQLLHNPLMYGRLNMGVQAKFQSSYGLALYENCIRYQNIQQSPWLEMPLFRKLMGVEDGKYLIFRDFKRRVIDKALEEVNIHSPITLIPKYKKHGHTVVAIQFSIQIKNVTSDDKTAPENLHKRLQQDFGLSKQETKAMLAHYDEIYILEKIALIESSNSFIEGKIGNLTKYLQGALTNDYQPIKSSQIRVNEKQIDERKKERQQAQENQWRAEYEHYQHHHIIECYKNLPVKKKKQIAKDFQESLNSGLYLNIYLRDGLENILIADKLCLFLKAKQPDLLVSVPSFQEFCEEKQKVCL